MGFPNSQKFPTFQKNKKKISNWNVTQYVDTQNVDNNSYVDNNLNLWNLNIHCRVRYVYKTPDMLTSFWPFERFKLLVCSVQRSAFGIQIPTIPIPIPIPIPKFGIGLGFGIWIWIFGIWDWDLGYEFGFSGFGIGIRDMNLEFRDLGLGFGIRIWIFGIWDCDSGIKLRNLGFGSEFRRSLAFRPGVGTCGSLVPWGTGKSTGSAGFCQIRGTGNRLG